MGNHDITQLKPIQKGPEIHSILTFDCPNPRVQPWFATLIQAANVRFYDAQKALCTSGQLWQATLHSIPETGQEYMKTRWDSVWDEQERQQSNLTHIKSVFLLQSLLSEFASKGCGYCPNNTDTAALALAHPGWSHCANALVLAGHKPPLLWKQWRS